MKQTALQGLLMAIDICVPRLGWSMETGIFALWLKQDGDEVRPGDLLYVLEGDKAAQEVESFEAGTLHIPATAPQPGDVVKVGQVLGYLLSPGEPLPAVAASPANSAARALDVPPLASTLLKPPFPAPADAATSREFPAAGPATRRLARELGVSLAELTGSGAGGQVLAGDVHRAAPGNIVFTAQENAASAPRSSPRARRAAKELDLDWTTIPGTGSLGRVRERDVLAAAERKNNSPAELSLQPGETAHAVTTTRRIIARRMTASVEGTAPVTLTTTAVATELVRARALFQAQYAQQRELVPSYSELIAWLTARVLVQHPWLNARWEESAIVTSSSVHMGMAVETPAGLLVPVLYHLEKRALPEIVREFRLLAELARLGKLPATAMQRGTFTITNLGAFGIDAFTPLINVPECAILGIGALRAQPAVIAGEIVPQEQITLNLTFDHRIVDGAPAARFLQGVCSAIENAQARLAE